MAIQTVNTTDSLEVQRQKINGIGDLTPAGVSQSGNTTSLLDVDGNPIITFSTAQDTPNGTKGADIDWNAQVITAGKVFNGADIDNETGSTALGLPTITGLPNIITIGYKNGIDNSNGIAGEVPQIDANSDEDRAILGYAYCSPFGNFNLNNRPVTSVYRQVDYAQLLALATGGNLVTGDFYVIKGTDADFATTRPNEGNGSTGHILVQAASSSKLSNKATLIGYYPDWATHPVYNPALAYTAGDYVIYNNALWQATGSILVTEAPGSSVQDVVTYGSGTWVNVTYRSTEITNGDVLPFADAIVYDANLDKVIQRTSSRNEVVYGIVGAPPESSVDYYPWYRWYNTFIQDSGNATNWNILNELNPPTPNGRSGLSRVAMHSSFENAITVTAGSQTLNADTITKGELCGIIYVDGNVNATITDITALTGGNVDTRYYTFIPLGTTQVRFDDNANIKVPSTHIVVDGAKLETATFRLRRGSDVWVLTEFIAM